MSIKKYILLMFEIWFHFYPAFTSNDARDVHTGDGNRKPIDEGTPIRLTTHGRIRGYFLKSSSTTAEVYEGVPYARPPVGNLRFRAPFPPEPWNGTFDCGRQKMKNCIEFWFRESTGNESEDCLYMNIVVPYATRKSTESENSTQLYPILIWVHGGSFQVGGASIYPLDNIVQNFASRSVIFVAINYRLGPLGFLTAGHRDLHGNYGLDDQIEAIRWMKANALNFDGDPNQITIGGENAGAASVSILAISPKTKGKLESRHSNRIIYICSFSEQQADYEENS
ncbi:hypothetical protein AB6A40_007247 [Gnathostoma spinigerum]|uniref:Carboxylesterase type B domain-containing protein n=1 Tax=Gnathostoma spinigerum TaxID=75299 RepID=A0ABD6EKY0_9BILA